MTFSDPENELRAAWVAVEVAMAAYRKLLLPPPEVMAAYHDATDADKHGRFDAPSAASVAADVPGPHLPQHKGGLPTCVFCGIPHGWSVTP